MTLELTDAERIEMHALADRAADDIDAACERAGAGRSPRRMRHDAADLLLDAWNEELPKGEPNEQGCKERVRHDATEKYGFIEFLILMVIVNVIARLIVQWLNVIWSRRQG